VNLSLIVIVIILCSAAVGYIIGVDVGIARAKRAAIETYRELHGHPPVRKVPHGIDEYV
jgi:uncharacterized integral membrane protein